MILSLIILWSSGDRGIYNGDDSVTIMKERENTFAMIRGLDPNPVTYKKLVYYLAYSWFGISANKLI